ncbi:hypothetical protein CNMCM8694_002804 [Aspergillus lentulus]|nr:hypothetical protein CNMCM8694_002804 [Aspergillus lentulus]
MATQPPQDQRSTTPSLPPHLDPTTYPRTLTSATHNIHLELTYSTLNPTLALEHTSSPAAGANVLFLGTTRNTFEGRAVSQLSYTSYPPLALKSLMSIATRAAEKFDLKGCGASGDGVEGGRGGAGGGEREG